jgi:hypothetical protein
LKFIALKCFVKENWVITFRIKLRVNVKFGQGHDEKNKLDECCPTKI